MTVAPKRPLSKERMYTIIRAPLITEKMTLLSEKNQVGFKVAIDGVSQHGRCVFLIRLAKPCIEPSLINIVAKTTPRDCERFRKTIFADRILPMTLKGAADHDAGCSDRKCRKGIQFLGSNAVNGKL